MFFRSFQHHCDVKISETIRPYSANASPKIKIRIIPTNILSCWALALTPASPTIPMAKPAAYISFLLLMNWNHSKVLMPNGHRQICRHSDRGWLHLRLSTSLNDDNGDDHTVNTQNTSHDHRHNWLHYEFGLQNTHSTNSDACFGTSVCGTKVSKDKGRCDSNVAEEVLWAVSIETAHDRVDFD